MREIDYSGIELLVLDVDGVLTDGRIAYTSAGEEIKSFNARDGAGMKYWRRVGKKLAIITGRSSNIVRRRAEELGVEVVRQGARNKLSAFNEIIAEMGFSPDQTAAVGDDLTDLPVIREAGFGAAVSDAAVELRRAADYVTRASGGEGAVREVVEHLLRKADLWGEIMARYTPGENNAEAT